jgi:hypothetical protein
VQQVGGYLRQTGHDKLTLFHERRRVHITDSENRRDWRAVEARGRHMNEATIVEWLPQLRRVGVALVIGFVPALIARWKRRAMTPWYLYGFVCALLAWPAVVLPTIDALLVRGKPEQVSQRHRRASALALLKEEGVRFYPSWIADFRGKSPTGMELRRYTYEHLEHAHIASRSRYHR